MTVKQNRKMSPIVKKYYSAWILNSPTFLGHPLDEERFFRFIKSCIRYSRSRIDGQWLRGFLEVDLENQIPTLDSREHIIRKAVSVFDTIIDYEKTRFPDHEVEMKNPYLVKSQLQSWERRDGKRFYSEEKIQSILIKNFGQIRNEHKNQTPNRAYRQKASKR